VRRGIIAIIRCIVQRCIPNWFQTTTSTISNPRNVHVNVGCGSIQPYNTEHL